MVQTCLQNLLISKNQKQLRTSLISAKIIDIKYEQNNCVSELCQENVKLFSDGGDVHG